MAWVAVGVAAVTAGASIYSANKADKAAKRQQRSLEASQAEAGARADRAREDVLKYYGDALSSVADLTPASITALVEGNATTRDILSQYTNVANSILGAGADEYRQAITGIAPAQRTETPSRVLTKEQADQATQPATLPFGLAGAEQAILGGEDAAREALLTGADVARQDLSQAATGARTGLARALGAGVDELAFGRDMALGDLSRGFGRAGQRLEQGAEQSIDTLQSARNQGLSRLRQGFGGAEQGLMRGAEQYDRGLRGVERGLAEQFDLASQAEQAGFDRAIQRLGGIGIGGSRIEAGKATANTSALSPYNKAGQQALQREAALSGALGAEAQQAAYDEFIESPGQKFLRERQEQSLLRNQAAIGGLGGGRIRTALQEQAQGIAAQDLQREIANLQSLSGRGQQAATSISDLLTRTAMQNASMESQASIARGQQSLAASQARANIKSRMADIAAKAGLSESGLRQTLGNQLASIGMQRAQAKFGTQQQIGELARQLGMTESQLIRETGGNVAGLQSALAQQQAGLDTTQAGLQSNLRTSAASQTANILSQLGLTDAQIQQAMGGNMANIAMSTGQNVAAGQRGAGQQIGGLRMNAGQLLGQQQAATRGQQAANLQGLGANLGRISEQEGLNISNILQALGAQRSGLLTGMGTTLANIGVGQSSQIAGMAPALAQASGLRDIASANKTATILNQLGQLAGNIDWGSMGSGSTEKTGNNAISDATFAEGAGFGNNNVTSNMYWGGN